MKLVAPPVRILLQPAPQPVVDGVPAALEPSVTALAELLAADHFRQQRKPYRVRLLPPEERGR